MTNNLTSFTLGQLSYLQIPALDVTESAAFYERLFGWQVDPPEPGFEAPGLIGQWVTDRPPAADSGLLAWINVESVEATLEAAAAAGGEMVMPPTPDGPRMLASILDPAGNTIGIVAHRPDVLTG